ncbi:TPA: hypothetical protein H6W19_000102 [Escherichia coli]|nr:hypothetical protein [Escherichia coli]
MTLTKEWLQQTIAELEEERDAVPGAVNEDATMALTAMKLALASLEAEKIAEPVAKVETVGVCWYADNGVPRKPAVGTELYAAPPAPVAVPDELTREEYKRRFMEEENFDDTYRGGWNACRAAMLQGADGNAPAHFRSRPAQRSLSPEQGGNSTVIPDGWVAVPVEPTEDMIVNGFESEPDESFSDEKEWEVYEAMSGCQQAAHRAKLCWAAMISAAPKI